MFTVHLDVAQMDVFWPFVALLGGTIGLLTGLFGVGGGFIMVPMLAYLIGVPMNVAVGSSLGLIILTGASAAFKHYRSGNVDTRLGLLMAAGGIPGAALGKSILEYMKSDAAPIVLFGRHLNPVETVVPLLLTILMIIVAVRLLLEKKRPAGTEHDAEDNALVRFLHATTVPPVMSFPHARIESMSVWFPLGIAFMVGIITGLLGVGGGFIMLPLLVYALGAPTAVAVGTSAFQIIFTATAAGTMHYESGNIDLWLVCFLFIGSFIGAHLGVNLSKKIGGHGIRKYFVIVLLIGIIITILGLSNKIHAAPMANKADAPSALELEKETGTPTSTEYL